MNGIDAQFSQISGNHALRDPRIKAVVEKLLQAMGVRGGIAALDPTMGFMVAMAASALVNSSLGSMLGIQNGADSFANIHQGILAAGGMPVTMGGVGGAIGTRMSTGMSSRSMAVASQLTNAVNAFATNPNGGLNTANTHGLNTGTLSQMAASFMARRGIRQGDVYEMNMGTSGADAIQAMRQAEKTQGINMQDADVKAMQKIAVVNEARRRMLMERTGAKSYEEYQQKVGKMSESQRLAYEQGVDIALQSDEGKIAISSAAKSLGVDVGDIKVDDGILAGARQMDKGALSGTFATNKLTSELQQTLKATSANVSKLGKIFNTEDFRELQGIADKLRLGSLTDKGNVDRVKQSLENAQATALSQGRSIQEVLAEQGDIVATLAQVSGGEHRVNRQSVEAIQRRTGVFEQNNRRGYDTRTKEEVVAEQTALELNAQNQVGGVAVLEQVLRENPGLKEQYGEQWSSILEDFNSGDLNRMYAASRKAQALAQRIDPRASEESFKQNAYAKSELNYNEKALRAQGMRNVRTRLKQFFSSENEETGLFYNLTGAGAGENRMSREDASALFGNIINEFGGDVGGAIDFFSSVQTGTKGKDAAGIDAWLEEQRKAYKAQGMSDEQIERRLAIARNFANASSEGQTAIMGATRTMQQTKGVSGLESASQKAEFQRKKDEATIAEASDVSTKLEGGPVDKFIAGLLMDGGVTERQALLGRATEGWTTTDASGKKVKMSAYDMASKTYNYKNLAAGGMTRLKVNWKDGKGTLETGNLQGQELEDYYKKVQDLFGVSSREELNDILSNEDKYKHAVATALRNKNYVGTSDAQGGFVFADKATAASSQAEYTKRSQAIDAVSRIALKGADVSDVEISDSGKLTGVTVGGKTYKGSNITVGLASTVKGNRANIDELKKIAADPNNPNSKRAQEVLTEVTYQKVAGMKDAYNYSLSEEELAKRGIGRYDDEGKLEEGDEILEKASDEANKYLEEEKHYDDDIIDKLKNDNGKLDMEKAYKLRGAKGDVGAAARDLLAYTAKHNTFTGDWEADKANFQIDESGYIKSEKGMFAGQNIYDPNSAAGKAYAEAYKNQEQNPASNIEVMFKSFMSCVVGNRIRITED